MDLERRVLFDQAALDYDAVRPGYPEELIDQAIRWAELPEGGRILEVGCGTGQATEPFARRGCRLLCLEPGEHLAALARWNLAAYPEVEIRTETFEDWKPGPERFDLVLAATAFHWIHPDVGYPKAASILRPGGSLVILLTSQPRPYSGFFQEVQEDYRRVVSEWTVPDAGPTTLDKIQATLEPLRNGSLFHLPRHRRLAWSRTYSGEEYCRLLGTFSDHRALGSERLERLLSLIRGRIDRDHGGTVERPFHTSLYVARRK